MLSIAVIVATTATDSTNVAAAIMIGSDVAAAVSVDVALAADCCSAALALVGAVVDIFSDS